MNLTNIRIFGFTESYRSCLILSVVSNFISRVKSFQLLKTETISQLHYCLFVSFNISVFITLGIKPAPLGHLFLPWGSPFYAPGLLSCDPGASFCALGSTFCTPTKIISTSYHQPIFFKCSKMTNLIMIKNLMNLE